MLLSAAASDGLWFSPAVGRFAIDTMAMGDYPYPSNYLTGGGPLLAAFPMRTGNTSHGRSSYLLHARTLPSMGSG